MSRHRRTLEAQLTPQQRKAAQLIVSNDWAEMTREDGRKYTMQELADQIGIARSTLYEWKVLEPFSAYVNYLTDRQLESMRSEVNVAIMKLVRGGTNGVPSVKALDLYMRRHGLLTDRTVVEDNRSTLVSKQKSEAEIREEIAKLDEMING